MELILESPTTPRRRRVTYVVDEIRDGHVFATGYVGTAKYDVPVEVVYLSLSLFGEKDQKTLRQGSVFWGLERPRVRRMQRWTQKMIDEAREEGERLFKEFGLIGSNSCARK